MRAEHQRDDGQRSSIDAEDLARFERLGAEWWDPNGPMGKLHEMNPTRMRYLRDIVDRHRAASPGPRPQGGPFAGLAMLDIGCGGGILAEPLARLGATVTAIDPAPGNIDIARRHAAESGLAIDYRATTAEDLAHGGAGFDVVLAMEVVEHVVDRDRFVATVCRLVRPGGLLVLSTLNRTAKSFVLAIVGAEYVLRWLPRGTHHWTQFVTPQELAAPVRRAGLTVIDRSGMIYDPLAATWRLGRDTDVNYFLAARRAASGAKA